MPVRADIGAGVQNVEESLHQIAALMQVVVQPQARPLLSVSGHGIEQHLIDALELGCRGVSVSHRC